MKHKLWAIRSADKVFIYEGIPIIEGMGWEGKQVAEVPYKEFGKELEEYKLTELEEEDGQET